jgi:hypothetical protein
MKTTIFNFLVLQVIVWAIVFSGGIGSETKEVNYAIISDSWQVAKVGEKNSENLHLQHPSFNKLTLNIDGSYLRVRNDESLESGSWNISNSNSILLLSNESGIRKYDIIQLPESTTQSFIIKDKGEAFNSKDDLEYELTRM